MKTPLYLRTRARNMAMHETEISVMSIPRRFRNKSPIDLDKEVEAYSPRKQEENDVAQEVLERDSSYDDDVAAASLMKTTQERIPSRFLFFSSLLLPFVRANYFQFCNSSYRSPIQSIAFYLEHCLSTHDPNKNMREFMRGREGNAMQQKLHKGRTLPPIPNEHGR